MKPKCSNFLPPAARAVGPPRQPGGGVQARTASFRAFADITRYVEKISIHRLRRSTTYQVHNIVKCYRYTALARGALAVSEYQFCFANNFFFSLAEYIYNEIYTWKYLYRRFFVPDFVVLP